VAINRMDGNAEPLHHSGVIGDRSVDFRVCTLKNVAGEALRCLHGPQRISRHRRPQRGIASHRSDRVDKRYDGNNGCVAVPDGGHHIGDYLRWDQRTRGVMNENNVDVVRQCDQRPGDRFRSRFSPRHNENLGGELLGLKQRTHVVSIIRWSSDHHNVDDGSRSECLHRIDQHRSAGDFSNGFRGPRPEAFTPASGGN